MAAPIAYELDFLIILKIKEIFLVRGYSDEERLFAVEEEREDEDADVWRMSFDGAMNQKGKGIGGSYLPSHYYRKCSFWGRSNSENNNTDFLTEFSDVMPPQLPRAPPPRRAIDHQMELVPGARPPAKAPYRIWLLSNYKNFESN